MKFQALLARPFRFIACALLIGALIGGLAAAALRGPLERWQVSLAFTINQRPRQETTTYAYDGYYALEAAQLYADTLIGWFRTPSVARDIYRRAGLPLAEEDAAKAAAGFRLKKNSSQVVVATFSARSRADAQALSDAARAVMEEQTAQLNLDDKNRPLFTLAPSEPVISRTMPDPLRSALVGALIAALLAGAAVFFAAPETKKSPTSEAGI